MLVVTLASAAAIIVGWEYYQLGRLHRSSHALHRTLAATGTGGLVFGIVAGALFVSNLLYLARRHCQRLSNWGTLRRWLDWHVLSGLLGSALVPVHAAFEMRSYLGQTCVWSLIVVVITGLVGRYLVTLVPRSAAGPELEADLDTLFTRLRGARASDHATTGSFLMTVMDSWRVLHRVASLLFIAALAAHVIGTSYYGFVRFS